MSEANKDKTTLPTIRTFQKDAAKAMPAPQADTTNTQDTNAKEMSLKQPTDRVPTQQRDVTPSEPTSVHSGAHEVFDVSRAFNTEGEMGTIVTDKRRRRLSPFTILKEAGTEWYQNITRSFEKKKKAKKVEPYRITPAAERKEIIEKATIHAHLRPDDDHEAVVKKMQALPKKPVGETASVIIKKPAPKQPSSWTHTRDANNTEEASRTTSSPTTKPPKKPTPVTKESVPLFSTKKSTLESPPVLSRETTKPALTISRDTPVPLPSANVHEVVPAATTPPKPVTAIEEDKTPKQSAQKTEVVKPAVDREEEDNIRAVESFPLSTPVVPQTNTDEKVFPKSVSPEERLVENPTTPPSQSTPIPEVVSKPTVEQAETWGKKRTEETGETEPPTNTDTPLASVTPIDEDGALRSVEKETLLETNADEDVAEESQPVPTPAEKPLPTKDKVRVVTFIKLGATAVGTCIILVAALYIAAPFFTNESSQSDSSLATQRQEAPLIRTDFSTPVPLDRNKEVFLAALRDAALRAQGSVSQLLPVQSGDTTPVSSDEVVSLLDLPLDPAFLKTFGSSLVIGSIATDDGHHPFLMSRTDSFDIAFTTMLSWERTMDSDLTPLFGAPVSGTMFPGNKEATTTIQSDVVPPTFKSMVVRNTSVRVLYDETGREHLVYAFLRRDTLCITDSIAALEALMERL